MGSHRKDGQLSVSGNCYPVSFSRTKTNDAQRAVADLAHRHSVGFVVTSSACQEVWLPYDHYMGLTIQLRPKTIDASDILNARAWQRGLNSFFVTSGDFDNRSAFQRFEVYKEQLSQAWGRPETVSRYCVWWRSSNDPLETINLKIEDNKDVLLVMHVS